jgi:hypothetical protein
LNFKSLILLYNRGHKVEAMAFIEAELEQMRKINEHGDLFFAHQLHCLDLIVLDRRSFLSEFTSTFSIGMIVRIIEA